MVDIIICVCSFVLLCIGDVSALYYCYTDDGRDKTPVHCRYKCCGKPTANSTETNLLPCCPKPNTDDDTPYFSTSVAGAVFTTVFSLVFLGSMCLCFQRILSRARSTRERRRNTRNSTNQFIMSVRDIRENQRRSGNLVIATIGDILSARYTDFDDVDEEEARVPKPADIDKQLPSYEEAIKFGIKGSPPPYDYNGLKSQTSTSSDGGLQNQAFQFDSGNEIQIEPSSLPYMDNTTQVTHNSETAPSTHNAEATPSTSSPEAASPTHNAEAAPPTYNLETISSMQNSETVCSHSELQTSATMDSSNNAPNGESAPPPYQ